MFLELLLMLSFRTLIVLSDTFPENFIFGVSTSAYQVEGAWNLSGRSESMWDWFTHHFPNKIADGSNGDVAEDYFHKYEKDIAFLKDIGVQFYRMSLSWSRILHNGYTDQVNSQGVEFYLTILKLLNESGIEPVVTIYHFDLPQVFNEMGGWTNPLLIDIFGDYARLCYQLFGDYVKYWITINEPQAECLFGYTFGRFAPGYNFSGLASYVCTYVHLLAHAKAYHIYHDEFHWKQQGKVSVALMTYWLHPRNATNVMDIVAVEKARQFIIELFAHPVFKGDWPEMVTDIVDTRSKLAGYAKSRLPKFTRKEIAFINGTADFFAANYYTTFLVNNLYNVTDAINITSFDTDVGVNLGSDPSWITSASDWLFDVPQSLRELINWIADHYGNPDIFIMENGYSDNGSTLVDINRIHYLNGHLCNLLRTITEDHRRVIGYAAWSLLDDFEWASGYTERFGIIHVDFNDANRMRTPKASYAWYKHAVQSKSINCNGF